MRTVGFTKMENGTADEYAYLTRLYEGSRNAVPDMLLSLLKKMQGDLMGYKIDRYTHCLQSATRAERDGADEETIVCALLHDIGDLFAPDNHSEVAAAILRPYVCEMNYWIIKHHGVFQMYYYAHHSGGDRNAREAFINNPWYSPSCFSKSSFSTCSKASGDQPCNTRLSSRTIYMNPHGDI